MHTIPDAFACCTGASRNATMQGANEDNLYVILSEAKNPRCMFAIDRFRFLVAPLFGMTQGPTRRQRQE